MVMSLVAEQRRILRDPSTTVAGRFELGATVHVGASAAAPDSGGGAEESAWMRLRDNSRPACAFVLTVAACSAALAAVLVAQGGAAADRAGLVALYEAAGGDGWTDNTNWLSDAPLGDWYGVEVNEGGRVIGLRLGGWDDAAQDFIDHGLTGSLPPQLGTLSHLRRLEIGGNAGLVGPIPAELSSLTRLEVLNLQANRLTGPIPPGLGRLPDLEELSLSRNPLSGEVPTELGNLTGLTFLDLRNTLLSGPLPERLTRLSALTWLQLEGSGLCVPDAPDFEAWVAAIRDFTGGGPSAPGRRPSSGSSRHPAPTRSTSCAPSPTGRSTRASRLSSPTTSTATGDPTWPSSTTGATCSPRGADTAIRRSCS